MLIIDCLVLASITGVANAVPAPVRELTASHAETSSPRD
jgi:hypothetical protein